jgi:hypothetical protein
MLVVDMLPLASFITTLFAAPGANFDLDIVPVMSPSVTLEPNVHAPAFSLGMPLAADVSTPVPPIFCGNTVSATMEPPASFVLMVLGIAACNDVLGMLVIPAPDPINVPVLTTSPETISCILLMFIIDHKKSQTFKIIVV